MKITNLTWDDIYQRLRSAPSGKLYGVPRGGAIVAGLTGRAVSAPEEADWIVDDVEDSGKTNIRWVSKTGKPFWSLITPSDDMGWVVFPWESSDPLAGAEDNVVRQLQIIGEDPKRDGLIETPRRVAKALQEMTRGYAQDPALILSKRFDVPYDEMVILRDIEFWSLCEHHMLPFHGTAHVGYIPNGKVVGISKLARLVDCFARRLQVQERLTQQIAEAIQAHLQPQGVGVVLHATHLCMAMRGVNKPADMVTSCLLGAIRDEARAEFLKLAHVK